MGQTHSCKFGAAAVVAVQRCMQGTILSSQAAALEKPTAACVYASSTHPCSALAVEATASTRIASIMVERMEPERAGRADTAQAQETACAHRQVSSKDSTVSAGPGRPHSAAAGASPSARPRPLPALCLRAPGTPGLHAMCSGCGDVLPQACAVCRAGAAAARPEGWPQ